MDRPLRPGDWVECVHSEESIGQVAGKHYRVTNPVALRHFLRLEGLGLVVASHFRYGGELASIALEIEYQANQRGET